MLNSRLRRGNGLNRGCFGGHRPGKRTLIHSIGVLVVVRLGGRRLVAEAFTPWTPHDGGGSATH